MNPENSSKGSRSDAHVPAGWSEAELGSILPLSYGKGLPARSRREDGTVPVYGSSGIVGKHDQALTSGPTIIVGRKGAAGGVHFCPSPCWPIDTAYFVDRFNSLNPKFFTYLLSSLHLGAYDQSTAIPSLSRDSYNPIRVLVPPAGEQSRIAAKLDELFSRIEKGEENLKRVQALVKQYRQSVLKAAVTGELTRDWRAKHGGQSESGGGLLRRILAARRAAWENATLEKMIAKGKRPKDDKWKKKYKEPTPPDTADLPELPERWVWATIDQLVSGRERSLQSGPFGSNLRHSEFQESGKLVIGIDNVQDGHFSMGSENRISKEKFQSLVKYRARPRDVLITVMATIGRTCVVPEDIEEAIITKHVYRITMQSDLCLPEFVQLCLQGSPVVRQQIFGSSQGQTRPGLNKSILEKIVLPLPSIAEQEAILEFVGAFLSNSERYTEVIERESFRCKAFRQSTLQAAFSGKLVPQNPADEPASVLLDRIAPTPAKREQAPSKHGRNVAARKRAKKRAPA